MQLIGLIIVGLIIGVLARLVLPGRQRIGLPLTLLLGVLGAVIAGMIASALGTGDIFELNIIGFLVAIPVAAALIAGAESMGLGDGGGKKSRGDLKR